MNYEQNGPVKYAASGDLAYFDFFVCNFIFSYWYKNFFLIFAPFIMLSIAFCFLIFNVLYLET